MTDATGFGLLGHLLEIYQGAKLAASVNFDSIPLLNGVRALAAAGFVTGASARNWNAYGDKSFLSANLIAVDRDIDGEKF